MIPAIAKSGRHEIGVHGWTHEYIPALSGPEEEEKLLTEAIDYLVKATGKRPAGYRAPSWEFGPDTLRQIIKAGFLYDSSMMAMDQPYELDHDGRPSGMIELPVSWALDDYAYFGLRSDGALPDPGQVFAIFRSEFDQAYKERTLYVLTMHPAVSGIRSRAAEFEKFLKYMKSKPNVWFATCEEIALYVKENEHEMENGKPHHGG